jgi:hypothetical protein
VSLPAPALRHLPSGSCRGAAQSPCTTRSSRSTCPEALSRRGTELRASPAQPQLPFLRQCASSSTSGAAQWPCSRAASCDGSEIRLRQLLRGLLKRDVTACASLIAIPAKACGLSALGMSLGDRRWRGVAPSGEVNDAVAAKALSVWQECRQLRAQLSVSQELLSQSTEEVVSQLSQVRLRLRLGHDLTRATRALAGGVAALSHRGLG